jgi:short-subunit dehydrogenase
MATDRKLALITGASSGIGAELARIHASRGGDLVITARRRKELEQLKGDLESAHGCQVHVIVKDLAEPGARQAIYNELTSQGMRIDYLINNAGFGYYGLFYRQDWARNEAMIEVNILALAALTRLFLPEMVARRSGRILNVGSMAGFLPGPLQAVYYATKAFVVSFSEALANELAGTGVTVTALCPGPVETEFAERAGTREARGFARMASPRKVARAGYDAMLRGRTIIVPGPLNKLTIHGLLRLAPRSLAMRISRSLMEKRLRPRKS